MRRFPLLLLLCGSLCGFALRAQAAPQFLDDEAERACDVDFTLQKSSAGRFSLHFDVQNAKNGYLLETTAAGASFFVKKNGQKRLLSKVNLVWKPQSRVVLQRRPWVMRLLIDSRVALTAFDSTFQSGKIGAESVGWKWNNARVQPVETIRFDDDFTRADGAGDGAWQNESGKWALSASSAHVNARTASMSSNPFAFDVSAPKAVAMSRAGRKFWDSYDARVAARPAAKGTLGIAAYVQDSKNYFAFLWSGVEGAGARRLIRVQNGVTTVLAKAPGAFLPRQWSEIGIRTSPGTIEALLDGTPVLRASDNSFGRGPIALLAHNMPSASFDDVRVRSTEFYRQNRATKNGSFDVHGAFSLTGRGDLKNYRLLAPLQGVKNGAFGLVAGWKDARNYTLFRAAGAGSNAPFHGRAQIVRYLKGAPQILSDEPLRLNLSGNPRLTLRAEDGVLSVLEGEKTVVQAAQKGLTTGQTGLYNPQFFAPETVLYVAAPPEAPKVATRMEDDAYMVGWASPTGEWPPISGDNGLEFWNSGEFFGAASLEFPWRSTNKGTFEVALRAARGKFNSGFVLRGESSDDQKTVKWTLRRGEKVLSSAVATLNTLSGASSNETENAADTLPDTTPFKIAFDGQGLTLFAAGSPLLSYFDPNPPLGRCLAVRSQGFRVRAERLHAISANRDDTTFTGAPTDFYATSGRWSIYSRWPCYGDWSFFGGAGKNPVLWSKRTYSGDIVAEMYAHPQMILPKEPGYGHPGDLNITLAGDGKNPASGYSFVLAGWDNTRSKVLRGNQVLVENSGPEAFFHETINHNDHWHRTWFHIRAEASRAQKNGKNGVQLTLKLDDIPILSVFDPNPLPNWERGGRVAFWTVDSTIMIARARVEAQSLELKTLPAGWLDAAPRPSLGVSAAGEKAPLATVAGDDATALVSAEKNGWKIQDPASGGIFEVKLPLKSGEITPQTRLEIDAKIPAGVKVDAYLQIGDALSVIEISGAQKIDAMAPLLGKMTKNGDKWSFDLGAALQKRFPSQKMWKIEALSLGARHGDAYRWLGFDGNALGATYHLSAWRLSN
ncbi:hypothetical protein B1R32_103199 [Abditibacterium utsteinense]|uniref:Concanavalin A-like lectin/glucanases superfamily protein n=1 Tax=Abditibacterium utsteinense TaxID=1960156 RepID=A0A2S8SVW5_9BACT|nr:hypothetical protein [Abditibacterium utsteinense]PQV64932.1 hypothetical protein B1R32_103199 [Abditibacterium utsteinense]